MEDKKLEHRLDIKEFRKIFSRLNIKATNHNDSKRSKVKRLPTRGLPADFLNASKNLPRGTMIKDLAKSERIVISKKSNMHTIKVQKIKQLLSRKVRIPTTIKIDFSGFSLKLPSIAVAKTEKTDNMVDNPSYKMENIKEFRELFAKKPKARLSSKLSNRIAIPSGNVVEVTERIKQANEVNVGTSRFLEPTSNSASLFVDTPRSQNKQNTGINSDLNGKKLFVFQLNKANLHFDDLARETPRFFNPNSQ